MHPTVKPITVLPPNKSLTTGSTAPRRKCAKFVDPSSCPKLATHSAPWTTKSVSASHKISAGNRRHFLMIILNDVDSHSLLLSSSEHFGVSWQQRVIIFWRRFTNTFNLFKEILLSNRPSKSAVLLFKLSVKILSYILKILKLFILNNPKSKFFKD